MVSAGREMFQMGWMVGRVWSRPKCVQWSLSIMVTV